MLHMLNVLTIMKKVDETIMFKATTSIYTIIGTSSKIKNEIFVLDGLRYLIS